MMLFVLFHFSEKINREGREAAPARAKTRSCAKNYQSDFAQLRVLRAFAVIFT
jgi:hypothetical protein